MACSREQGDSINVMHEMSTLEPLREPLPPFTEETAKQKVQKAEDAWNTRDPEKVALAYTPDSVWRNRDEFLQGREAIKEFLTSKWKKENDYRLRKELWCYQGNRIAVCFQYEFHNAEGKWFRAYGNEVGVSEELRTTHGNQDWASNH
eukprot:jgi/Botrbrau1/21208/Bobra.39_2s0009.2